jgi:hypothetical protein
MPTMPVIETEPDPETLIFCSWRGICTPEKGCFQGLTTSFFSHALGLARQLVNGCIAPQNNLITETVRYKSATIFHTKLQLMVMWGTHAGQHSSRGRAFASTDRKRFCECRRATGRQPKRFAEKITHIPTARGHIKSP